MTHIDIENFKLQLRKAWGGDPLHLYLHPDTYESIKQGGYSLRTYTAPSLKALKAIPGDVYYHLVPSLQVERILAVNQADGECLEYGEDVIVNR